MTQEHTAIEVTPADRDAAEEWRFMECRHCSEYEGDFVADLAADFARRRQTQRVADEWSAYMDEAVSKAPEPLQELGKYLASVLDEDRWKTAERHLNAAVLSARAQPSITPPEQDRSTSKGEGE